jgi:Rrf2 family iron-sulfur cluster assembly transcriptional regulator
MVDLALHSDVAPVARRDIAERQDISADYVAQLFHKLQDAGLVDGVKGPGGGYRLARDVGEITAGDVVQAVEGPVALVHCVDPHGEPSCQRVDRCVTHLFWRRLSVVMKEFLDAASLQDLVDEAQRLRRPSLRNVGFGVPENASRGRQGSTIASGSHGDSTGDVDLSGEGAGQ